MSVTRECMLQTDKVNWSDTKNIADLLNFLKENNVLPELENYQMKVSDDKIELKNKTRSWDFVRIETDSQGRPKLSWDEHYQGVRELKDKVERSIESYYVPYVTAKEFLEVGQQLYGNASMMLTEDMENIVVVANEQKNYL
ncbi:MAG TPA: hypothetical protein ENO30_05280 [Thermodesulfobium narugense]|nr:hypothetical protein [Thermodesulfobium narugense]